MRRLNEDESSETISDSTLLKLDVSSEADNVERNDHFERLFNRAELSLVSLENHPTTAKRNF